MTKVLTDPSYYTAIANAIRTKNKSTATYKPSEMADAIAALTTGSSGGESRYGMTIDNFFPALSSEGACSAATFPSSITFTGIVSLEEAAFRHKFVGNSTTTTISFPDLVTVANNGLSHAFEVAISLEEASFPKLQTAKGYSFANAFDMTGASNTNKLARVSFPLLSTVENNGFYYAFRYCSHLKSVEFPLLTTVVGGWCFYYAFDSCSSLTSVSFPVLTSINNNCFDSAFSWCTSLESVSFTALKSIGGSYGFSSAFSVCSKLTYLSFDSLETIDCNPTSTSSGNQFSGAFNGTGTGSGLSGITVHFPKLKEIYVNGSSTYYGTFYNCSSMVEIYLPSLTTIGTHYTGTGTVSTTAASNIFSGCSKLTTIHFSQRNMDAIQKLPGYETCWGRGAGKATIVFDPDED